MARRMTRTAANSDDDEGLVQKKDFARAMKIYYSDIHPASSSAAEMMQEISTAYKLLKRECGIQSSAAKMVFKLLEFEESRRDDWLRAFSGLCEEARIYMPSDLVDAAEGNEPRKNVVKLNPKGASAADAGLVTIPADDSDLAGEAVEAAIENMADRLDEEDF